MKKKYGLGLCLAAVLLTGAVYADDMSGVASSGNNILPAMSGTNSMSGTTTMSGTNTMSGNSSVSGNNAVTPDNSTSSTDQSSPDTATGDDDY